MNKKTNVLKSLSRVDKHGFEGKANPDQRVTIKYITMKLYFVNFMLICMFFWCLRVCFFTAF